MKLFVLCSVILESILKNIVCKNGTIAKEVIHCVCIHAYVFLYICIYMLEVANVKNSIITMLEFRQVRFVKLERHYILYTCQADGRSSTYIGVDYSLLFTPCSYKNGLLSGGEFFTIRKQNTQVAQFFRCIHKLRKRTSSFVVSNLIGFILLCYGTAQHLKRQQGIRRGRRRRMRRRRARRRRR